MKDLAAKGASALPSQVGRSLSLGAVLLETRGLRVAYRSGARGEIPVVWDVDLTVNAGEILGLTGESGSGKSTVALTCMGYKPGGARILGGRSLYGGFDLFKLPVERLRGIWGRHIAYIPQDAASTLNPSLTIGHQLAEPLKVHLGLRGRSLLERQVELLSNVGLADPEAAFRKYPHQFSGGQQQRILIAIALSCEPSVLVLDEPTTGLDVTTQARITRLIRRLVSDRGVGALFVSHNLALAATFVDRLAVMYAGEIVEQGPVKTVVGNPRHPYTQALLQAVPSAHKAHRLIGIPGRPPAGVVLNVCSFAQRCPYAAEACMSRTELRQIDHDHVVRCIRADELTFSLPDPIGDIVAPSLDSEPLLRVEDLWCTYPKATTPAVKAVSLTVGRKEPLGIVGESGSGKSTLLRNLIGLVPPQSGSIWFQGQALQRRVAARPRSVTQAIQLIFQNPDSSLNPRHTVEQLVERPIALFRGDIAQSKRREAVVDLLAAVKLPRSVLHSYPMQLSGGQRQRVAIARAFAARPALLLCDEVTSSLDVSVQATVIDLIADLSTQFGTAVIFVSHDFGVVRAVASRVLVMKDGEVCEEGTTEQVLSSPSHPYTVRLIESIPDVHQVIEGGLR